MAIATLTSLFGLFGDEVYSSTDLNRRSAEVLDHARKRPVTISRNGEQFALLNREQASRLVRANCQFGPIVELVEGALSVAEKRDPPTSVAWLKAYDVDDLRKMIREVLVATVSALRETGDWDAVDSIIHEWHESALVDLSGVLDEAMSSPSEEVPLSDPRSLLEPESQVARPTARGKF
jgi:prevent-host-death family protein